MHAIQIQMGILSFQSTAVEEIRLDSALHLSNSGQFTHLVFRLPNGYSGRVVRWYFQRCFAIGLVTLNGKE